MPFDGFYGNQSFVEGGPFLNLCRRVADALALVWPRDSAARRATDEVLRQRIEAQPSGEITE